MWLIMWWFGKATVARKVEDTRCSLIIGPNGSRMLDKDSPYVTPLEEAESSKWGGSVDLLL